MPAPKRKSPDGKRPVRRSPARQPGLVSTSLVSTLIGGAGRAVARHPKPLLGMTAFGVIFSFVAANALWYQPGDHPHPFLATRDAQDPNRIAGYRPMHRVPPSDVTTFRIERADTTVPSRAPAQTPALAPGQPRTSAPSQAPAAPLAAPSPLQNPQQQAANLPATPPALPPAMSSPVQTAARPAPSDAAPIPQPMPARPAPSAAMRPSRPVQAAAEDPVAAAIRASDRGPAKPAAPSAPAGRSSPFGLPPADIPNTGSTPLRQSASAAATPAPRPTPRTALPKPLPVSQKPNAPDLQHKAGAPGVNLVLQIQRGLSNIAYADVETNGIAGAQTKSAIRAFQKHYRLAETGEPNEEVLRKLKSIGAL